MLASKWLKATNNQPAGFFCSAGIWSSSDHSTTPWCYTHAVPLPWDWVVINGSSLKLICIILFPLWLAHQEAPARALLLPLILTLLDFSKCKWVHLDKFTLIHNENITSICILSYNSNNVYMYLVFLSKIICVWSKFKKELMILIFKVYLEKSSDDYCTLAISNLYKYISQKFHGQYNVASQPLLPFYAEPGVTELGSYLLTYHHKFIRLGSSLNKPCLMSMYPGPPYIKCSFYPVWLRVLDTLISWSDIRGSCHF